MVQMDFSRKKTIEKQLKCTEMHNYIFSYISIFEKMLKYNHISIH